MHASIFGSFILSKRIVTTRSFPKRCCRRAPLPGVHGMIALCNLIWELRAKESGGRKVSTSFCNLASHVRLTWGKRSIFPVTGSSWSFAQLRPLRHWPRRNHRHGDLARLTFSTMSRGKWRAKPAGGHARRCADMAVECGHTSQLSTASWYNMHLQCMIRYRTWTNM